MEKVHIQGRLLYQQNPRLAMCIHMANRADGKFGLGGGGGGGGN